MGNDAPCVSNLGNDTLPVSRGLGHLRIHLPYFDADTNDWVS